MAAGTSIWGIDIGQTALKALKLRAAGDGKVEVVAFDLIEHPKILSQSDADPDELVRGALEKFASRNDWAGDQFAIGVPGQQTFARFCKMPPVDQKKVPDLVRFEASQQIPFDIDDVVWDYQTFSSPDSPDLEVGIFAMRKELIRKHIDFLANVGIAPTILQTIPSALYNFCRFDQLPDSEANSAIVLINVGAQNTDLVIVEPNSAWTRNIPLGGNSFTEALVRAFKLSFAKAESLKRTAATNKYARQIFQAMRPVFAELVAEIQRSIGFYSSTHRDVELKRVLALGNAFRLPGLQKYLENNLTISGGVVRLEKFARAVASATANAPQLTENILAFPAAYGLAIQGLGLAQINANLLPSELARVAVWRKKRPYFVAAAACLGLAAFLPVTRNFLDRQALGSTQVQDAERLAQTVIADARRGNENYAKAHTNTAEKEKSIKQLLDLQQGKSVVPQILALVYEAMPPAHQAIQAARTPEELKRAMVQVPRPERRQFLIDSISVEFVPDVDKVDVNQVKKSGGGAGPRTPISSVGGEGFTLAMGAGGRGRGAGAKAMTGDSAAPAAGGPGATGPGFQVVISGRLLLGDARQGGQGDPLRYLTEEYYAKLRELGTRAGLGFFLPDEDPKADASRAAISRPTVQRASAGGPTLSAMGTRSGSGTFTVPFGPPGPAPATPETGPAEPAEDTSSDWQVDFAFKVKLGDKPAAPAPKQK